MNTARVAALLRELADELDTPVEAKDRPSVSRSKGPRLPVRPPGESDDLARRRASKLLRERGFIGGEKT